MRWILALAVLFLSTDRADACTCSDPGPAANLRSATAVFVGTITQVTERQPCPPGRPKSWCKKLYLHEMTVEGVWKGGPGKTVTLDTGHGSGDCSRGGNLGKGTRWLIFARGDAPAFRVRICAGNTIATPAVIDAMTRRFGAPKPPA